MKILTLAIALFAASTPAQARDLYHFHKLGFSKDGKYFAFAESVIQDGSGFATAEAFVVDVAANDVIASKEVLLEKETATEEQALARAVRELNPSRWGIGASAPKGEDLLVRLLTDHSTHTDTVFTTYYHREYRVKLEATALSGENNCISTGGGELLKLTLENANAEDEKLNVTMQDDRELPKRRNCAASYSPSRVIRFGDSLVVMVDYRTNGFEGSDAHYMAVTGKVKLQ